MATRRSRKHKRDRAIKERQINTQLRKLKTEDLAPQDFNSLSAQAASDHSEGLVKARSFYDLPGEIRNTIYSFALQHDGRVWNHELSDFPVSSARLPFKLASSPPPHAKALSHVSHLVRAESMAMHYGKHKFTLNIYDGKSVRHTESWIKSWGVVAASNIRSLDLNCGSFLNQQLVTINLDNSAEPAKCYQWLHDFPYNFPSDEDVNQLLLLLVRKQSDGRIALSPARLMALLRSLVPFWNFSESKATAVAFARQCETQKREMMTRLLK